MFDPKKIDLFPSVPGVYLMKDAKDSVIYVGKAKDLRARVKQYFIPGRDTRAMVPLLVQQVSSIDTIVVPSEKEALLLEHTMIKKHKPKFNILLKDDKTFISIMINNKHQWPMLKIIRYKGKPKKDGLYFGPYTSALAARQVLELLQKLFPLRQCSDDELKRRTRPCILYSIKRCIAPCVQKCTKEEYDTFVQGAVQFLKGKDKELQSELYKEMERASENLEYEKAAAILYTLKQISHVTDHKQVTYKIGGKATDAIGLYRSGDEVILAQVIMREGKLVGCEPYSFSNILESDEELLTSFILQHYEKMGPPPEEVLLPCPLQGSGLLEEVLFDLFKKKISLTYPIKGEKKQIVTIAEENAKAIYDREKSDAEKHEKILLDMQETFSLGRFPKRIECFDVSHISGSDLVASMVVFTDGKIDRKAKRLFIIKNIHKGDDYGALHQALSRHLLKAKDQETLPDLIMIDGGKGQLHIAVDVLKELDIASIDLIALTKEEGRHDKGMTNERVFLPHHNIPIELGTRSPILHFLQKVRDEAHRSVITFHGKRRKKRLLVSALDNLPGIGPKKKKILLQHFGSVKKIREATKEDLSQVAGISQKDIENILKLLASD